MSTIAKKIAFHTLGCKLNFSETSKLSRDSLKYGYENVRGGMYTNSKTLKKSSPKKKIVTCYRCGRQGHYATQCYAKTTKEGYSLNSDDDFSDDY